MGWAECGCPEHDHGLGGPWPGYEYPSRLPEGLQGASLAAEAPWEIRRGRVPGGHGEDRKSVV